MGYTETNEKLILDKLNKSPIQDIIKGQYKFYDVSHFVLQYM